MENCFLHRLLRPHLNASGIENAWKDARELIVTDSNFGYAAVDFAATNKKIAAIIFQHLQRSLFIVPGFIASDAQWHYHYIGQRRVRLYCSHHCSSSECSIVGNMDRCLRNDDCRSETGDQCKDIPHISYQEAMELSHFGAKVIYPPTIQPVMSKEYSGLDKKYFCA